MFYDEMYDIKCVQTSRDAVMPTSDLISHTQQASSASSLQHNHRLPSSMLSQLIDGIDDINSNSEDEVDEQAEDVFNTLIDNVRCIKSMILSVKSKDCQAIFPQLFTPPILLIEKEHSCNDEITNSLAMSSITTEIAELWSLSIDEKMNCVLCCVIVANAIQLLHQTQHHNHQYQIKEQLSFIHAMTSQMITGLQKCLRKETKEHAAPLPLPAPDTLLFTQLEDMQTKVNKGIDSHLVVDIISPEPEFDFMSSPYDAMIMPTATTTSNEEEEADGPLCKKQKTLSVLEEGNHEFSFSVYDIPMEEEQEEATTTAEPEEEQHNQPSSCLRKSITLTELESFLANNNILHEKILAFIPLEIDEVQRKLKEDGGYSISKAQLLQALDALSIFVTYK